MFLTVTELFVVKVWAEQVKTWLLHSSAATVSQVALPKLHADEMDWGYCFSVWSFYYLGWKKNGLISWHYMFRIFIINGIYWRYLGADHCWPTVRLVCSLRTLQSFWWRVRWRVMMRFVYKNSFLVYLAPFRIFCVHKSYFKYLQSSLLYSSYFHEVYKWVIRHEWGRGWCWILNMGLFYYSLLLVGAFVALFFCSL